jgi:hypothetical protein
MDSVQSFIRAKVKLGEFPAPKGAEAFSAYAIASGKKLIPEMESAARQTLDLPMTFETLQLLEKNSDHSNGLLDSFLSGKPSGPSKIWIGCQNSRVTSSGQTLPRWLTQLLSSTQDNMKLQKFTHPFDIHLKIREEYTTALQNHGNCYFCFGVHIRNGSTFCAKLEKKLAEARHKVVAKSFTLHVPRDLLFVVVTTGMAPSGPLKLAACRSYNFPETSRI